jgi:uncharacterized flavoprotein (TIGR03862 family)
VSTAPILVIGGGPAGLRAAEVARVAGANVTLYDAQRSVGRKFLIAGRGGLNLTHGEPVEKFPDRYVDEPERWRDLLREFSPEDLRKWAADLEVETYAGTSGRIFPRGQKAAILLRRWVQRLRASGVQFQAGAQLTNLDIQSPGWRAHFGDAQSSVTAPAIVLALGGASWPETGSDGNWPAIFASHGIEIAPWQPANCGWNVDWPSELLSRAEGLPLKNLNVRVGDETVSGELLITKNGLEGGAIYRLGRALRSMEQPTLTIDFKPQLSVDLLRNRAANLLDKSQWFQAWKLSAAAVALLEMFFADDCNDQERVLSRIKSFTIPLRGPRPITEAISSAGGIRWCEIDENMMLRKMPGIFVAGEMIDWEAPTGGYLLQGCFSTGTRAGRAAAERLMVDGELQNRIDD